MNLSYGLYDETANNGAHGVHTLDSARKRGGSKSTKKLFFTQFHLFDVRNASVLCMRAVRGQTFERKRRTFFL
jgi:hypothetical protein